MYALKRDTVEYKARSIRIGTMKTSAPKTSSKDPDVKEGEQIVTVTIDKRGIRFTILPDDDTDDITIKIPRRRIKKVLFYSGRSCPTLWITTDEVLAERFRSSFNMKPDGPNFDPTSSVLAEREISIISAVDTIPYTIGHSISAIFKDMSDESDLNEDLFEDLPNTKNNEKLVRLAKTMAKLSQKKNKLKIKKEKYSESDTDEDVELTSKRVLRSTKAEENDDLKLQENIKQEDVKMDTHQHYCDELLAKLSSFTPEKNAKSKALISKLIYQIEFDKVVQIK